MPLDTPMPVDPRERLKRSLIGQATAQAPDKPDLPPYGQPPVNNPPPWTPPKPEPTPGLPYPQKPELPPIGQPPVNPPPNQPFPPPTEKPGLPPIGTPPINNPPIQPGAPPVSRLPVPAPKLPPPPGLALPSAAMASSNAAQPTTAYDLATTNAANDNGDTRPEPSLPQINPQPAAATAAAPAPAAQTNGGGDKKWLDWINATYGKSQSRGTGFSDLPAGVNLSQVIDRYNAETGANAKYIGGNSGDQVDFGEGVTDALTSGGQLWSDYGAMSGQARNGASSGGGAGQGGGNGLALPTGAGGAAGSSYQQQIRDMVMKQLLEAQSPVDVNGQEIAAPFGAAKLEAERNTDVERKALAERRAATGDTSGSLDQGIQQSNERNAVGLGTFKGKLIQQAYENKRQKLESLLQLATASGDAESARAVQMQMAELEATLRREGYSLDAGKYSAYLNQRTVESGL